MWKLFRSRPVSSATLSIDDFRKFFVMQTGAVLFSTLLLKVFFEKGLLSQVELVLIFVVIALSWALTFIEVLIERLRNIFPKQELNFNAIAIYSWFPIFNIPLILMCLFTPEGHGRSSFLPLLKSMRYALFIFVLMLAQPFLFGFGPYPASLIKYNAWITSPSFQKGAYVAAQAKFVFEMKDSLKGKTNLYRAIQRFEDELPMDSTGHILSVAVLATDVFSRKKEMAKRDPATASKESILWLLDGMVYFKVNYLKKELPWYSFSPLVFLSPANMIDAIVCIFVEQKINEKFLVSINKKMTSVIDAMEKESRKNNFGKEFENQLSYYRKYFREF